MNLNPADFTEHPWDSVTQDSNCETIAVDIMKILKRTGNTFRPLSWDEYKQERLKDGKFSDAEQPLFEKVIGYCQSAEQAQKFSRTWRKQAN